jgi:mannose-6-phosphate isomerase-like protein (cupin superfamily)
MGAFMKLLLNLFIYLSLFTSVALAQDSGAPPAIYKPGGEIDAELDHAAENSASAGGWSVSVAPGITVRRRGSSVEQYAVLHPFSIEIYRILEGSGTLVTGGLLIPPLAESTNPNIIRTLHGVNGGLAREVKVGDILVLQPGTPHWFSNINGESITYMESRVKITNHPIQYQQE